MKNIKKYIKRKISFLKKPLDEYKRNKRFRIRAKYSGYINKYKVKSDIIFYESYHGQNFTGNVLAIFLKLREMEQYSGYTHVIVCNELNPFIERFSLEKNVVVVTVDDDKYLKYLAKAKYLINNTSFPYYFIKRDEQIYINTWHGTPLKTLGIDIKNAGITDHKNIQRNLLQTDILVSPNEFTYKKLLKSQDIFEVFPGKVADIGYPRVDLTLNNERSKVLERLGIPNHKKVVLYAPTWRGSLGNESDTSKKLLDDVIQLKGFLGSEYVVVLKAHFFAYKYFKENNLEEICIPNYFDTNILLAGVDILITDYSSIFFEFLPTDRTVIFYGEDIELYGEERGFYLNLDTLPGPLCYKINEVAECIKNEGDTRKQYNENYKRYKALYCYNDDGNSTLRFIEKVLKNDTNHKFISTSSNKEKVLFYCGAFYNNGITTSVLTLLDNIDFNKYEVVVIESPEGNNEKWNNIKKVNSNVHFIYRPGELNKTIFESYRHQWILNRGVSGKMMEVVVPKDLYNNEFKRIIGNVNFDYAINFGGYSDFWGLIFAFSGVKNKAIYLHADMAEEFNKKINGKYKHKKTLKVIFSIYKYYDKVVSVAESTHKTNKENLQKYVPNATEKMTYVNNLVNDKKVNVLKDSYEVIQYNNTKYLILDQSHRSNFIRVKGTINPDPKDVNFVTIGRLSPEKGHEKLIRAFSAAIKQIKNMKLYIAGEGPLKEFLQELIVELNIKDNVFLVGQVENPFALINRCDCFILSSNYEGQGLVLLETMIIGKPIIATDVTGVRSVLEGGYGKLVENSESALAKNILEFALVKGEQGKLDYPKFDYIQYNKQAMERFYNVVLNNATIKNT
ncbi:CDP-glycerol glycerophosphotransferase family protein [Mesobacillus maritimus]|uniref:CDP-glycerol glycerophosphotransferase family protein n=1 Tax=Mesobacillus maritimus TaxID=1643336 RepID=A0ABS7K4R8_9BACI|nr:CDP-glycerol glycerophosphotransferase family protein [Mesobacillus maritimus]